MGSSPIIRILVAYLGVLVMVLNKPLGRITAAWQTMLGMEPPVETLNRILYVICGAIFLTLALWAN